MKENPLGAVDVDAIGCCCISGPDIKGGEIMGGNEKRGESKWMPPE